MRRPRRRRRSRRWSARASTLPARRRAVPRASRRSSGWPSRTSRTPGPLSYLVAAAVRIGDGEEQALLEATRRRTALRLLHVLLHARGRRCWRCAAASRKVESEMTAAARLHAAPADGGDPAGARREERRRRPRSTSCAAASTRPTCPRRRPQGGRARADAAGRLPPAPPNHQVIRTYLELVLELPWKKATTEDVIDLADAEVLDEDHFGLDEVKERILEDLAVLKLNPTAKAPILCFVGPPGVGKTSLGQSIARALGRKFERISASAGCTTRRSCAATGGRTSARCRAGSSRRCGGAGVEQPGADARRGRQARPRLPRRPGRRAAGGPRPGAERTFRDNYLDLPFDLSKVFFIMTANSLDPIPRAAAGPHGGDRACPATARRRRSRSPAATWCRGRPSDRADAGAGADVGRGAARRIIRRYTREAGVRELERTIGPVAAQGRARAFAEGARPAGAASGDAADAARAARAGAYRRRRCAGSCRPGVATGLAWTEAGGDVLYVEATSLPGRRGLTADRASSAR